MVAYGCVRGERATDDEADILFVLTLKLGYNSCYNSMQSWPTPYHLPGSS